MFKMNNNKVKVGKFLKGICECCGQPIINKEGNARYCKGCFKCREKLQKKIYILEHSLRKLREKLV